MRLFLNFFLFFVVFNLFNSSCQSLTNANLCLVSTIEQNKCINYELPKILYNGKYKDIIPQKRWVEGKIYYSVDTFLSRHIENHIREIHRFTEDAIYKFHIRLKIDDKGNVCSLKEIGNDLSLLFNDENLKQVFINEIFEYVAI